MGKQIQQTGKINQMESGKNKKKHVVLLLLFIVLFSVGFLRDYVFENINRIIGTPKGTTAIGLYRFDNIYYILKWILTELFSDLYLLDGCLILYLLYREKIFIKITIAVYLFLMLLALLSLYAGHLSGNDIPGYRVARDIMGFVQSPVLVLLMLPAFALARQIKK